MNAVVTGATSGIGFHTAAGLHRRGYRVLVTGRDERRGAAAVATLRESGDAEVAFVAVDHTTLAGNRSLAAEIAQRWAPLDVLVNNVGVLLDHREETADGLETTLATNFVGPAVLTRALLPVLRAASKPCVVNVVSSSLFMWKRPLFEDLEARQQYVGIDVHARAKLLNAIWAMALARRLRGEVAINAVNPGMAWTPMTQSLTPKAVPAWRWIWPIVRFFQRRASAEKAARGPLELALSEARETGQYIDGRPRPLPPAARDEAVQEQVWELASKLGGD